jgi:hypothetical protein
MIQPDEIRRKAENLYPDFLRAWWAGDASFFPRLIPSRRNPDPDDLAGAIQSMRRLREGSKETRGFGYHVEWRERNSRTFGRNQFPERISFESQEDFLRFLGKEREFAIVAEMATQLRTTYPSLESWLQANLRRLPGIAPDRGGLVEVLRYFVDHPRPNVFARELPLSVDTKFIERHANILREWLDLVLPPHAIRADERKFEHRYGLRSADPHLLVRLLDSQLGPELGFPCPEFSLPLDTLASLPVRADLVLIVENKVNLLTLPPVKRGLGLGALGDAATRLRHVPWLKQHPIVYWGDVDVEGLQILSSLRALFPQTRSLLMDLATLDRWSHLVVPGSGHVPIPQTPAHLTESEQAAFARCRDGNLRLEQERIPQADVLGMFTSLVSDQ